MMSTPAWVIVVTVLLAAQVVAAAGAAVTGWIESFDGPREQYRVLRAGRPLPVELFMTLRQDDEIIVQPGGRVKIVLDGGRVVEEISAATTSRVARREREIPSVLGNVLDWAAQWFTRWHDQHIGRVDVYVRGGPIELLMPPSGGGGSVMPRLVAGARSIFFAWDGGVAPYHVVVEGLDGQDAKPHVTPAADQRSAVQLTLRPGRYVMEVRDARTGRARGRFVVVAGSDVPAMPALPRPAGESTPMVETLAAAWLAAQGEGQWVLEAYQRVVPHATRYYPATLLRDALERGERPLPMIR